MQAASNGCEVDYKLRDQPKKIDSKIYQVPITGASRGRSDLKTTSIVRIILMLIALHCTHILWTGNIILSV